MRDLRLAPGIPDLAALGARRCEDLLGIGDALAGEEWAEVVSRDVDSLLLRFQPFGRAIGPIYLRRYRRAGLASALRARLTRPRSASLAAREWNMICHLRGRGVSTPEPLAVGAAGSRAFATRSFLVTRGLERMLPLAHWLDAHPTPQARHELARALGLALRRAFDAGAWLPRLAPRHVFASARAAPGAGCGDPASGRIGGLAVSRLPEIAFAGFAEGRLLRVIGIRRRARWLARFGRELADERRFEPREAYRVFRLAIARAPSRAERRAAWRSAVRRSAIGR